MIGLLPSACVHPSKGCLRHAGFPMRHYLYPEYLAEVNSWGLDSAQFDANGGAASAAIEDQGCDATHTCGRRRPTERQASRPPRHVAVDLQLHRSSTISAVSGKYEALCRNL